MNDEQVMHAMSIDDAYKVERVLARHASGTTELVTLGGAGPFVRRRIHVKHARREVWGALCECHCARLPHVEAMYEMPDEFVVVYDYVPGVTLEQLVADRTRLPEAEAAGLAINVCEAVAALHARGIVHRDISPGNVIVANDGAHLIDFDIARIAVDGARKDTSLLGTWGFASPEQYGFAASDNRTDVFSLGRLLGYMLTGTVPGEGDGQSYERLLDDESVVSAAARAVIDHACALDRSARYQTVSELMADLERLKSSPMPSGFSAQPRRPMGFSAGEKVGPAPAAAALDAASPWRQASPTAEPVDVSPQRLMLTRAAAIVLGIAPATIFGLASIYMFVVPTGDAPIGSAILSFLLAVYFAISPGRELYLTLSKTGIYALEPHPVRRLLIRLVQEFLVLLMLFFILVVVSAIFE